MNSLIFDGSKKHVNVIVHASAWTLYGTFIFVANYLANPSIKVFHTLLFLAPHCLTFYVSVYCLGLYKQKGTIWSIASFFIVFVVMATAGYLYIYVVLPTAGIKLFNSDNFRDFIKAAVLGYVQYFSYALLYFYVVRSFRKEKEFTLLREEKLRKELENSRLKEHDLRLEQERLQLEYAFLRSQVNPHFLHNTLNALFSHAMEHSQELANNIARLARMMQYSMEGLEAGNEKVFIGKELDNLKLLFEINKMRFEDTQAIDFSIDGEIDGQQIPPLALITPVENAFKYADLKDPKIPLKVRVVLRQGFVYFYCSNKKKKPAIHTHSTNIGIANLGRRLEFSFKNKYIMKVYDKDDFYTFKLFIKN